MIELFRAIWIDVVKEWRKNWWSFGPYLIIGIIFIVLTLVAYWILW